MIQTANLPAEKTKNFSPIMHELKRLSARLTSVPSVYTLMGPHIHTPGEPLILWAPWPCVRLSNGCSSSSVAHSLISDKQADAAVLHLPHQSLPSIFLSLLVHAGLPWPISVSAAASRPPSSVWHGCFLSSG